MELAEKVIQKTIHIHTRAADVWEALTNPTQMKLWLLDSEINVITTWEVGKPIIIKGSLHWTDFENIGTVLHFEPYKRLQYNYQSNLSHLADKPENDVIITFNLSSKEMNIAELSLTLSNFTTETIYKHLNFYWNTTLGVLKNFIKRK